MNRTVIVLMIATIMSKVLGFFREQVLSYFYGTSDTAAAYGIALTIPAAIFAIIGAGIATGYIPLYSKIQKKADTERADLFTSNLINGVMLISTIIVAIVLIFTPSVVKIIASGYTGEVLKLTVRITRFTIVGVYFTAIVCIFTAYLNLKENFLGPVLVSVPMNIGIIIAIIISSKTNTEVLSIGTIIAMGLQVLFLIPFVRKSGYKHKLSFNRKDEYIKNMITIAIPVIIGISVNQINTIVDKNIASTIGVSAIPSLDYAIKLNGFVQGLFVTSIVTTMYPRITKMAINNNVSGLKNTLKESIISASLFIIPTTVGTMIFSKPIVKFLFERGEFNSRDTITVSGILFCYSIGMIGYGLREVISKVFYAIRDTKTPMINSAIAVIINIILSITLSRIIGVNGIALATSIAGIWCTITLFFTLRKKIGPIGLKSIGVSLIKIISASIIMGFFAKIAFQLLNLRIEEHKSLVVSVFIGILVYFISIYFMKIKEVNCFIKMLKNFLKNKLEHIF